MTSDINKSFYDFISNGMPGPEQQADVNNAILPARKAAFSRFRSLGLPTLKTEEWRYTNIQRYLKDAFTLAEEEQSSVTAEQLSSASIPKLDSYTAVLVNGRLQTELSQLPADGKITISKISDAAGNAALQNWFDKHPHLQKQPFAALNAAFFADGLFVEAGVNASLDKPLHIVHVYTAAVNAFIQPHHLVVLHKSATLELIETSVNLHEDAIAFVNSVTEVILEENAELWHYNVQSTVKNSRHIYHTSALQKADSRYHHFNFTLPAAELTRNNLSVALTGSNTETNLHGLFLATETQHVDNHTFVDHQVPHCNSNELYKGVLLDNAKGVFTGKIMVHQDAQKTNAFQQNNNLLMSEKANINSQPQLEIYADDVKCSHGFTVGRFSEEALFYLRSRGIGEEAAKTLMVNAFAFDITDQVHIPALQAFLSDKIRRYVTGAINN
ncbi:Fe-S cluster assembly protein SufD [Chitinophaga sancti]|uniref:Fe-S cluster assembly protein SufD n=2 Tax=Chitinophaga sancti TaxID=1004 RepID=A0ABZ0XI33_9BACT|nr:Fe-S cluster assembly protein SufD [Chitinophaga sancti]WQD64055.1 Fe-S cluster assembly protein SufD [Chitinophaga sancti]WQG90321.1 Fe-S cluster assembly protein SufD [Chitinophaga sancti]